MQHNNKKNATLSMVAEHFYVECQTQFVCAECHTQAIYVITYAKCCYAECRYARCRGAHEKAYTTRPWRQSYQVLLFAPILA
jgi:hypothetical protein